MAFDQIYPVGGVGDDQRMNALMQLTFLINAERGAKAPNFFDRLKLDETAKLTPKQVDAKIIAFYKAQKAAAKERKRKLAAKPKRKTRKDKGVKRGPVAKPSINTENNNNNEV